MTGRPPKWNNPTDLQQDIAQYFETCREEEKMPNKAGLALSLGVHKDTLHSYGQGEKDTKDKTFSEAIKEAYNHIEDAWIQRLGGPNATGAIFYLKAAYHYSDRSEVDITTKGEKITESNNKVQSLTEKYEKEMRELVKK